MTAANVSDSILGGLDELRAQCPELRFGQLLAIIGTLAEDETEHALWDVEDADFAAALERFATDMAHRGSGDTGHSASADGGGSRSALVPAPAEPPRQLS